MLQSNPDAGDPNTSDSNRAGVWTRVAGGIKGKFVEVTADRTTRRFVSRGEISFMLRVNGMLSAARRVRSSMTKKGDNREGQ